MQHDTKRHAAVAIATAIVFGFAFGAGTAIAGHDPGHEKLLQQTERGPDVLLMHEEMEGSDKFESEADFELGSERLLEHELMEGSDVYDEHEGRPGPEPHE